MNSQLHYLLAVEIARERTRAAEAGARLRWGLGPGPSLERDIITRLAGLCRAISRAPSSRDERCRWLERAAAQQPRGGVPA
jgi:hypothetical protein